jgi:uncharacterized protein (DUF2147 family)
MLVLCLLSTCAFASPSPVGTWLATSPFFDNRPVAIVKTYLTNGKLCGTIVKVIPVKGNFSSSIRAALTGPVMMCDFREENGEWVDGNIYEQTTATIYSGKVTMSEDGQHLYVRGYRGVLFRTATWNRIK